MNETRILLKVSWGNLFPHISAFLVTGRLHNLLNAIIFLHHKKTESHFFRHIDLKGTHFFFFRAATWITVDIPGYSEKPSYSLMYDERCFFQDLANESFETETIVMSQPRLKK